jgi:hypothetical protein
MSDSVFSLIILVYVSVAFCIVFFLFCWKASNGRNNGQMGLDFKQQCPLMTNELQVTLNLILFYLTLYVGTILRKAFIMNKSVDGA